MPRTGEAAHVGSDLCEDDFGQASLDAWDRLQTLELCLKRAQTLGNLLAQFCNVFLQAINMGELLPDQEAMMGREASLECLGQQITLRTHTPTRELSQGARIPLSLKQRLQHGSGRGAHQVDFIPKPA